MWLFLAFLLVPLIEIALFIQIGGAIGLGWTLLIVVITAVLGTMLVRAQGMQALGQVKSSFNQMRDPSEALAHGAMILFSGALLLTPGFFTDAVGFALLVPAVRLAVFHWAKSRVKVTTFTTQTAHQRDPNIVDGEYTEVDPDQREVRGPSGWTKH
ncbi:FxsA family protein [Tateyamaria sp. ANG-S1]|uniref:FxsA family protein n=1 Tax=Tateyamaria sp. ANG-S1 TaxID=1577905 RepID=UPI0005805CF6|nr:FxsA family protein [Tateyamaria sp. ANG-S1]KIC49783.1 exlusion protein FxsA [Tateyamaria sp. ANG-S1]